MEKLMAFPKSISPMCTHHIFNGGNFYKFVLYQVPFQNGFRNLITTLIQQQQI